MQTLFGHDDVKTVEIEEAVAGIEKQTRVLRVISLLLLAILVVGGTYLYFQQPAPSQLTCHLTNSCTEGQ